MFCCQWEREGRQEDVNLVAGVELTLPVVSCWYPVGHQMTCVPPALICQILAPFFAATRCTEPDLVIENGEVNISRPIGIGSLATFGCDGNFVLEGPIVMTRVCGDAGWSGINPSCSE